MDSYLTVEKQARVAIKIKKSKFIASIRPIENEEEAKAYIESIRREFKDASHNPYAYVVNDRFSSSDDGEPLNTAGKQILDVILKKNLKNLVIVVTRYFGGIKLGVGGLIRAYREATLKGIDASGIVEKFYEEIISFSVDYSFLQMVNSTLYRSKCRILDKKLEKRAFFKVSIRKRDKESFINDLLKRTRGDADIAE